MPNIYARLKEMSDTNLAALCRSFRERSWNPDAVYDKTTGMKTSEYVDALYAEAERRGLQY